jgi:methyl-accepting chemotaxis protein
MDGNYLSVGALALAAGSYGYTYSQVNNIQKEITKVAESIKATNESIKTYDDNVKHVMEKNTKDIEQLTAWSNGINTSFDELARQLSDIQNYLSVELGYQPPG